MRIPALTPGELDPDQRDVYEAIAGGRRASGPQHFPLVASDGSLRGPFNAFLYSPAVGGALQKLGSSLRFESRFTDREREVAILLVAAHWHSDFERESHEAVGAAAGLSAAELHALRASDFTALPGTERLIGEVVLALLEGDVDEALWTRAGHALDAGRIFELTTLVGYYSMLALQLRVFRV